MYMKIPLSYNVKLFFMLIINWLLLNLLLSDWCDLSSKSQCMQS